MISSKLVLAGLALALSAAPAAAVTVLTFNFAGPAGISNTASTSRTTSHVELTATARKFTLAPNTLTNLSQTTSGLLIQQAAFGIGVNGGGSAAQIDTNLPAAREGILFTSSVANFSLRSFTLSSVDSDDTLQIYGVNADNSFTSLGFTGVIKSSLGGATVLNTSADGGTSKITLTNPTAYYTSYFFTTRVGGDVLFLGTKGQGYAINSISGTVPEPATWAMLVLGFGMTGFAARRRSRAVTA